MICTNIRERYNTLNLPAQINCPELDAPDAVEGMMHPDQRAIVAAGRKVNAMFETISQVNKNVLQVSPCVLSTADQHLQVPTFCILMASLFEVSFSSLYTLD